MTEIYQNRGLSWVDWLLVSLNSGFTASHLITFRFSLYLSQCSALDDYR